MTLSNLSKLASATAIALTLAFASSARATTVDLINNDLVTLDGAVFEWNAEVRAGSGIYDPIVRVQAQGNDSTEEGYNTSGRPVPFDELTDLVHTHNLVFGDLAIIDYNGGQYYQFLLDINESNAFDSVLSLDEIQIYTSPTGSQTTTDVASLGTLRYDLDASSAANEVILDHDRTPGSGRSDMSLLVPVSAFAGTSLTDFVYLYSSFGARGSEGSGNDRKDYGTSDGFEEWRAVTGENTTVIPSPAALPAGLALVGLLAARRRRSA